MAGFGRGDSSVPDGYRRAKNGEVSDTVINGVPLVRDTGRNISLFDRISGRQDEKYGNRTNSAKYEDYDARNKRYDSGDASSMLSKNEGNASQSGSINSNDGVATARRSEDNISREDNGGYVSKVSGRQAIGKLGKKSGRLWRRMVPIILAAGGISSFGIFSFFGQMAMPFSLISQFQSNFDSISISNTYRSGKFTQWQMDSESRTVKDCIKSRIFGADKFKISKKQRTKLAAAGITVDDSGSYTVMKYTNANGVEMTIVPDSRQATGGNVISFEDAYENNQGFRDSYSKGSRTWRGSVMAWFDNLANKFLKRLGVTRGVWSSFKRGDQDNLEAMRSTINSEAGGKSAKGSANAHDTEIKNDDDGNPVDYTNTDKKPGLELDPDDVELDGDNKIRMETPSEIDSDSGGKLSKKLKSFGDSVTGRVAGMATAATNIACSVMNVVGAINLVVVAYQTTQIIGVASSIFEAIQKGQVEDSTLSPLHEVANSLTMQSTQTYQYYDSNNQYHEETRTRSAMEAEAISALYGNHATNHQDASIQSFNLSNSLGAIATMLNFGTATFKACTYAQLAAGVADAVKDGIDLVLCAISFGIGCIVDAAIDAAVSATANVAIGLAISTAISALLPLVAQVLTRKIASDVLGEDLGNALASGANKLMGENHLYSGGAVSNLGALVRAIALRDEVNADKARVARETLSPFDYTSQYTFMGTLVSKLTPVTVSATNVVSSIGSFGNVLGSAISSLMPGASAVSAAVTAQEAANDTAEHCPDLDAINAVGDAFCNPYIVTDTRTLDEDPASIVSTVDTLDNGGNFEDGEGDVPTIKEDSKLAKYIIYCGQRQSPFGMADNNTAQEFMTTGSTGSQVGDSIVGAVPIAGDVVGALQQTQVLRNYGYVSGEACVVDNVASTNAVYADWSENQQYQRFIEDQRLAENEGLIEKSAVTAFLENYYEKHPIDDSYEGTLARRSGLTKEQVATTLDAMEFIAWYNDYDPSEYSPYVPEEVEETQITFEETKDYGNIGLVQSLFFEERRIRNFAA